MLRHHTVIALSITLAFFGCSAAFAQGLSTSKPIRLVTSAPGGGGDLVARILAEGLASSFGYKALVENRGGAGGIVQAQVVQKAPADGHTLLVIQNQFWLFPFLQDNVPYDPVKDFAPVTQPDRAPNVLVVHPSLPVKSVRQLIAFAKARPGQLNYARPATGSGTHLAVELLNEMAGIKLVGVPYKGGAAVALAVVAGEVELAVVSLGGGGAQIKANRLRALAVTSLERSSVFPELPTMSESGLPGYEAIFMNAIFVPAGTPASVISALHQDFVQVLRRDEVKAKFLAVGLEPVGSSPQQLADFIKADMVKWGRLIKSLGLRG